jgi:hypothetical protein
MANTSRPAADADADAGRAGRHHDTTNTNTKED